MKQHGVISRSQAKEIGLTDRQIAHRVKKGIWRKARSGVFHVWRDRDSWKQQLWTVLLWLGPTAAASHRTAAALFDLEGIKRGPIEVTVTGGGRRNGVDALIHRTKNWEPGEVGKLGEIPITSMSRTIMDLAAICPPLVVESAMECALRRDPQLIDRLQRQVETRGGPGNRGITTLRKLIADHDGTPTGSPLELEFERFCKRMGLPKPIRQYPIRDPAGSQVARADFAYPNERVVIEIEGFEWHSRRAKYDSDIDRYNLFGRLHWKPIRVTSTKMRRTPDDLADLIKETLRARSDRLL